MSKVIEQIQTHFKPPIMYNKSCKTLNASVSKDLELTECLDGVSRPIYDYLTAPSNSFGKQVMSFLPLYYTTDKKFLKDTQYIIKNGQDKSTEKSDEKSLPVDYDKILKMYEGIKNNSGFKDKYCFLDWKHVEFLNKQEWFMQFMSMYNLSSPVLSFLFPVILLVVPFFVIKSQGNPISVENYIVVLKKVIANHAIGKVFTQFNSVDMQQKIYLLVSAGFYSFSIYQNALICMRSYNNMYEIYHFLSNMSSYLTHTIDKMQTYSNAFSLLPSYKLFNENLKNKIEYLSFMNNKLLGISGLDNFTISFDALKQIGRVMTEFYEFYDNGMYHDALVYSFGFHGYLDVLDGLTKNVQNGRVNFCDFKRNDSKKKGKSKDEKKKGKKEKKKDKDKGNDKDNVQDKDIGQDNSENKEDTRTSFVEAYYPALMEQSPVKNTYDLSKDIVITGPNAAGKTTILKSTLINVITSQQFGCGCYSSATIKPYSNIHCYLNIPDTIGRDSLLQAEARRCKDIIDAINAGDKDDTHLCIFDEIYSGTNPEEATTSANAVMNYLANKPNVTTVLTTHYIELCRKLESNKNIVNCCMKIKLLGESEEEMGMRRDFEYTYLLIKGISEIKGGIKVLIDMKYPEEILANA
jgi:hypothetical protein